MSNTLPNIRRALTGMKWAIIPEKLEAMIDVLEARIALGRPFTEEEIRARLAEDARPLGRIHAAVRSVAKASGDKVAVLRLTGLIMPKSSMVNGPSTPSGTSCEQFAAELDAAVNDASVSAIVIQVDSPGGSVVGVSGLAERVRQARDKKKITAVADSLAASAAYWIASAASEFVVVPDGEVGSIGVFCVHAEGSEYFAKEGIKHTIIKAGEFKAEGNPYEPLSPEAKAAMQSDIDEFYDVFVNDVAKNRNVGVATVIKNFGKGRCVLAKNAVVAGMVDRVESFESVLRRYGISKDMLDAANARRAQDSSIPMANADAQAAACMCDCQSCKDGSCADCTGCTCTDCTCAANEVATNNDTTSGSAGVAAVPVLTNHETLPAPKGQEFTVPETASASPSGAAPNATELLATERKRVQDITALCREHNVDDANVVASMIERGITVNAAGREILALKSAELNSGRPVIRGGHDRAADKPWANFGEQLFAIKEAYSPGGRVDVRLAAAQGMNQGIPSEGGVLVTPQFSQKIWDGLASDGDNLLARTDNYTVEGESLTFPANAETSRATGSRYGGVQGYWIAEADQITKSAPKLRNAKVEPQQMAVLVYVTEKLLRNSPVALDQYVTRAATSEIAFMSGDAIVNGTGVGKPKGLLASGSLITVAKETSQPNTTFNKKNANKMWSRLHPNSRKNAIWLYNVDVEPQFDEFSTAITNVAGTENVGGISSMIYNADKNTLKGRPLVPCEFCATLGTVGDVILWDPTSYLSGTRGGIDTAMSMHVRFEYAEMAFRFIYEMDGQPWLASALTPFKGSNTLSTHIALAGRP